MSDLGDETSEQADEAEVAALSDAYEAALLRNDVDAMNAAFWVSSDVLRFGIADAQRGYDEVVAWRATASPVNPRRVIRERTVTALASGVVAVDIVFDDHPDTPDAGPIGRQSQTWVRTPEGWRIARAHVSVVDAHR